MPAQWQEDFDHRQRVIMAEQLSKFRNGVIDLRSFIDNLDSLLNYLEQPTDRWKKAIRRQWEVLEEVYAVSRDRMEQNWATDFNAILNEPENQRMISLAIDEIRRLLNDIADE